MGTSGFAGALSQVGANTDFVTAANEIFNRRPNGAWSMFAKSFPITGKYLELDAIGPSPEVQKMLGSRVFTTLRAYGRNIPVVDYSAPALEIDRITVEGDKSGIVAGRLTDYLSAVSEFFEKPVIDLMLTNPVGLDGVALLSDSHPYGPNGGTWDNLSSDGLTQTSLEAGIVAMRSAKFENGAPQGFFPTHLVVGPGAEREALDLTGADRAIPYSSTGVPDATSSVVGVTTLRNWVGGRLDVIVVDRFADGTNDANWILMDLSKPNVRPIAIGELIAPRGVVDITGDAQTQRNANVYYVDAAAAIGGYAPYCMYGKLG
jgi:phage major head subunit gpT-like protein